jgi:hypothetical protein
MRKADLRAGMLLSVRGRHSGPPTTGRLVSADLWNRRERNGAYARASEGAKPYRSQGWSSVQSTGWPVLVSRQPGLSPVHDLADPSWDGFDWEGWDGQEPDGIRVELVCTLAALLPYEAIQEYEDERQRAARARRAEQDRQDREVEEAIQHLGRIRAVTGLADLGSVSQHRYSCTVELDQDDVRTLAEWLTARASTPATTEGE